MRFINCSYRKKLPEGGEMRQIAISSPCLPPLLLLISWNHSTYESVLCFISEPFCCRARQSPQALEMSPVLSARPGLTVAAAPSVAPTGPASCAGARWASLTHLLHPLPCRGRVQLLLEPVRSLSWTETTDLGLCQSLLLYPNTIVLHRHTPRGAPHHFAVSAFLLLVKALRFPHPLITISLVSFFTGKWHQERHFTTNSAN